MDVQEIETRFTYRPPKGDQTKVYSSIRGRVKVLAAFLTNTCPESRELSLAITHLEEAVFWANAAVARRG